jgi:uncharacterized membrane protein YidH (DUF202 family)
MLGVTLLSAPNCVGTGCPGTTGNSHVASYVVGFVLVAVGAALEVLAYRRNRVQRGVASGPAAATTSVTLGRAGGLLAVFIGVLCLLFPF